MLEAMLINLPKGTKIKVTESKDDTCVGMTGVIRHNFPDRFWTNSKYILSIKIDKRFLSQRSFEILNLIEGDKYTPTFCEYNEEHDCYFIQGRSYIYHNLSSDQFNKTLNKYGAEYNLDLQDYAFNTKEDCENCINYFSSITKSFSC